MNIYFDGLFFNESGIGRYYESLLVAFLEQGLAISTCVNFLLRDKFESKFSKFSSLSPIFVNYEYFSFHNFAFHFHNINKLNNKFDVYFFSHINQPFFLPKNSVLTLHDFRSFTHFWDRDFQRKIMTQFLYRFAMCSAKNIVCISDGTKKQLKYIDRKAYEKSQIIYEFVDDKFLNPKNSENIVESKYILFVGTRKKHKNVLTALRAFARISASIPHSFVLAGRRDGDACWDELDAFIVQNNLNNRVIQRFSPTDDEVTCLYRHADLFVFPSLYEGFGLPPLEAVSSGCPAILSDIPIFREIFGDAALYFAPRSPEALAALMLRLLMDEQARGALLAKEKERLKLFDKEKIVASYIDLFERVAR
ncbi:MAG: glycosyltransferase family 1 protein [Negativicutes bacterium]|nr:glycosyltransferase family 1 protein [Negativicutes bacterium]